MSAIEFKYNEAICELESLQEKVKTMDALQQELDSQKSLVAEKDKVISELWDSLDREHANSMTTNTETERWKSLYETAQSQLEQDKARVAEQLSRSWPQDTPQLQLEQPDDSQQDVPEVVRS